MIHLQPTPDVHDALIVIGTAIRKPPDILRAYLDALDRQVLPPRTRVTYHFVLDTEDPEAVALVETFVKERTGLVERVTTIQQGDFDDNHPTTHQWNATAMARVGQLKNRILHQAHAQHAEAVWFCDADLICDDHTLRSLWFCEAPVACAVYWTRWHNNPNIHAAPQVWLRHPYELSGRGYPDEASFRRRLQTRELTKVWGQGACTLIRKEVMAKGVSFAYVPGIPTEGMMAGEDRHFCLQCESKHIPMIADPWPHIFHCYHPQDREAIPYWTTQIDACHHHEGKPTWVSLRLRMLEPVPVGAKQLAHMPPLVVRRRFGSAAMLPDLEAQVLAHLHGEPFIAQVNFPSTYEIPVLRGKRRLFEVTVIDAKTEVGFPVLEEEMPNGFDLTTYTHEQQEALRVGL